MAFSRVPARAWGAILLFAAAFAILGALPAEANHVAGATYTGTVSGGGTVSFSVSADGSRLDSFAADSVPGNSCTFGSTTVTNIAILNHSFTRTASVGMSLSGSFPRRGEASGTLRIKVGPPISCDTGTVSWSASTPVPPDTTAPQTTISSGPSGGTLDRTPTFKFRSSERVRPSSASWTAGPSRPVARPIPSRSSPTVATLCG